MAAVFRENLHFRFAVWAGKCYGHVTNPTIGCRILSYALSYVRDDRQEYQAHYQDETNHKASDELPEFLSEEQSEAAPKGMFHGRHWTVGKSPSNDLLFFVDTACFAIYIGRMSANRRVGWNCHRWWYVATELNQLIAVRTLDCLPYKAWVGKDEVVAMRAGNVLRGIADDFGLGRTAFACTRWQRGAFASGCRRGKKPLYVPCHESLAAALTPHVVLWRDMALCRKLLQLFGFNWPVLLTGVCVRVSEHSCLLRCGLSPREGCHRSPNIELRWTLHDPPKKQKGALSDAAHPAPTKGQTRTAWPAPKRSDFSGPILLPDSWVPLHLPPAILPRHPRDSLIKWGVS